MKNRDYDEDGNPQSEWAIAHQQAAWMAMQYEFSSAKAVEARAKAEALR